MSTHRASLDILLPLLAVVLCVDIVTIAVNLGSNDDVGTYTAQGWAVRYLGDMAHYTYWYDHPPAGWIQIALYALLTDGFERREISVLMAGELMVIMQLVGCVLIFRIVRLLVPAHRWAAGLGVVLFALSPLAIFFQKLAFLDNIAVAWTLAAMAVVASPRRSLGRATLAGIFMAIATLSKETAGVWLLVVGYMLWQNYGKEHRKWGLGFFLSVWFSCCAFTYGIYAITKGELFPGEGHVSLLGSFLWQLSRGSAGSPFDGWMALDYWLLLAAAVAGGCVLLHMAWRTVRKISPSKRHEVAAGPMYRLRPIMVGLLIMAFLTMRGGYVPPPLIIGALPFAAIMVAGLFGVLWPSRANFRIGSKSVVALAAARVVLVFALFAGGAVYVAPTWIDKARLATSPAERNNHMAVIQWVKANVPKDAVIAVDNNMWVDLKKAGYTRVVWFYKLDLDPEVVQDYIPNGYADIDYVVLRQLYYYIARDSATDSVIVKAEQNSELVAQIGDPGGYTPVELTALYNIRKVNKGQP